MFAHELLPLVTMSRVIFKQDGKFHRYPSASLQRSQSSIRPDDTFCFGIFADKICENAGAIANALSSTSHQRLRIMPMRASGKRAQPAEGDDSLERKMPSSQPITVSTRASDRWSGWVKTQTSRLCCSSLEAPAMRRNCGSASATTQG